jgi:hypothetical protein
VLDGEPDSLVGALVLVSFFLLRPPRKPANAARPQTIKPLTPAHANPIKKNSAGAVHLFHCVVYYFELRMEDIVHHLVFGGLLSILNFSYPWGRVTNHLLFFITGLPGGITYALLVAVKLGRLKTLREKGWTATLNTWVRAPGLVWCVGVVAACLAHGFYFVPTWAMFACMALEFANGTYYGKQALENYVQRRVEKLQGKKAGEARA